MRKTEISKDHFDINIVKLNKKDIKISAKFISNSFEWIRLRNELVVPVSRIFIKISKQVNLSHLIYKDDIYNFQESKNFFFTEINVSLFENKTIDIFSNDEKLFQIKFNKKNNFKKNSLIDLNCSRHNIKVSGLSKNETVTISCQTIAVGSFGKQTPKVKVTWMSPDFKAVNNKKAYHSVYFTKSYPITLRVKETSTNKVKEIKISAKIPKRLHRLFTAFGFGPYSFTTQTNNSDKAKLVNESPITPALFFYMNYKLSEKSSLRAFDAAIFKESQFNNAGFYLANDFGFTFDNRLYFSTLLGVQYLYFSFNDESTPISQSIFPQGIEFMYKHAFDIPNYIVSGGDFLSTP